MEPDILEPLALGSPLSSEDEGDQLEDDTADGPEILVDESSTLNIETVTQPDYMPSLEIHPAIFDSWLKLQREQPMKLLDVKGMQPPTATWMDTKRFFKPPFIGMVPAVIS